MGYRSYFVSFVDKPYALLRLTIFSDVLAEKPEVYLYVYDRSNQEAFLGLARMTPDVSRDNGEVENWFRLEPRNEHEDNVSGEIHIQTRFHKAAKTKVEPADFDILKLIGKGASLSR